jgi:hypothetical protein
MATNYNITYYLLEGMLNNGLPFVGSYLEKNIGYPIIIMDPNGRASYPNVSNISPKAKDLFINIPGQFISPHYYDDTTRRLYYSVGQNPSTAIVIVDNIPSEQASKAITVIKDSELALKYHFSLRNKQKDDLDEKLWNHFFVSASASIPDMLKLSEKIMDSDKLYFVSILDTDENSSNLDWNLLRSYVLEISKKPRQNMSLLS